MRAPRVAIMHTWSDHADRRLVAAGVRQRADAVRLHQRRRTSRRTTTSTRQFDVDRLPARRPRHGGHRQRHADVRAIRCRGRKRRRRRTSDPEDQTDDMRPGLGWMGVAHLQDFVQQRRRAADGRWTRPTSPSPPGSRRDSRSPQRQRLRIVGSVVRSKTVDATSPIAYGYTDNLAIWCDNGPIFNVSSLFAGGGGRRLGPDDGGNRPTGRGTTDDADDAAGAAGRRASCGAEGRRRGRPCRSPTSSCATAINVIPPSGAAARHPALRRQSRELLVSGLVENGSEIAQHAAVVDVPLDKGHVVVVLEQPDLARRDPGQLLPRVQRAVELRPAGRGAEARQPLGREGRKGRKGGMG